jgi:hypothetical protein
MPGLGCGYGTRGIVKGRYAMTQIDVLGNRHSGLRDIAALAAGNAVIGGIAERVIDAINPVVRKLAGFVDETSIAFHSPTLAWMGECKQC